MPCGCRGYHIHLIPCPLLVHNFLASHSFAFWKHAILSDVTTEKLRVSTGFSKEAGTVYCEGVKEGLPVEHIKLGTGRSDRGVSFDTEGF